MIQGIKESLQNDKLVNEEYDIISEMADAVEDDLMEENAEAISPTERKEIEKVLKQIPDDISDDEDVAITKKDLKATKKVAEPSPSDLTESFDQLYNELTGGM